MWIRTGTNAGIGYLVLLCVSSIMLQNSFSRMNGNLHTKQKNEINQQNSFVCFNHRVYVVFSSAITSRVAVLTL